MSDYTALRLATERNADQPHGENLRASGLRKALSSVGSGRSSRLASYRAQNGLDVNGMPAASVATAVRAGTSAPARASAAKPAKANSPAAKISDEQLRLNYRSFAVLSDPKAEGKSKGIMAMLSADRGLSAAQAIALLDTLPFDDPQRNQAAISAMWDRAIARVCGSVKTSASAPAARVTPNDDSIEAMTARNIAKLFPGQAK